MTNTKSLHVVLGAGQVGSLLTHQLLDAGHRVRVVRRSKPGPARANLEQLSGDITDLAFAERATAGAATVYDCTNPAYHEWPRLLLAMGRGSLHGATQAGARLVALDCLYMYGRPNGGASMYEDSPMQPCSKKGELRRQLSELRMNADARGECKVAIARGSDFYGADLPNSNFSDRFFQRLLVGKSVEALGNPDMLHSYTYVPDVVRAMAILGDDERQNTAGIWHVPTPAAVTTRALMQRLGAALDRHVKVAAIPNLVLRGIGLFSPLMRELVEMTYQYEIPYIMDDTKFRTAFGMTPTSIDQAVTEIAAWARTKYNIAQAA